MNQINEDHLPSHVQITRSLERLSQNRSIWGSLPLERKKTYLQTLVSRLSDLDHRRWGEQSALIQGYSLESIWGQQSASSETLINILVMKNTLKALIQTYDALIKTQSPPTLTPLASHPPRAHQTQERTAYRVFPRHWKDRLSINGMAKLKAEVWTTASPKNMYKTPTPQPEVCLVLGAGNQTFLAFGDLIYKMFVEGHLCVLKHHPLRSFSHPFLCDLFKELIDDGFFFALQTDLQTSQWLCDHPLVDSVHMTGGKANHDAIVWGKTQEEQAENRQRQTPRLSKPMTSELGCVTPWVVVPGTSWTQTHLHHQVGHLLTGVIGQASCNCLAPKVLVIDQDWPQAEAFIDHIRDTLGKCRLPPPYYPATAQRYHRFIEHYQDQKQSNGQPVLELIESEAIPPHADVDDSLKKPLPWLLIHLDQDSDPYALQNEAFAPVLAIYRMKTANQAARFLHQTTSFLNQEVWGTLSCTLIVHPDLEKQKETQTALNSALEHLDYGSIAINAWTSLVYALESCTWGGSPNEQIDQIESGIGFVRNTLMMNEVDRCILRAPFINPAQIIPDRDGLFPVKPSIFYGLADVILKPGLRSIFRLIASLFKKK